MNDLDWLIEEERKHYESLALHDKFLISFWEYQWHDWDYWEIDCGFEWKEEEINIHDVAEWIENETKWISCKDSLPKEPWKYLVFISTMRDVCTSKFVLGDKTKSSESDYYYDHFTLKNVSHWKPLCKLPI